MFFFVFYGFQENLTILRLNQAVVGIGYLLSSCPPAVIAWSMLNSDPGCRRTVLDTSANYCPCVVTSERRRNLRHESLTSQ